MPLVSFPEFDKGTTLRDYAMYATLAPAVQQLETEAALLVPWLRGRRIWMVNSTDRGGGVAEMMPQVLAMLGELGLDARWAVIGSDQPRFFQLTKRLHNLIHDADDPRLDADDRELFEEVSRRNAQELERHVRSQDLLVVHDPQPIAVGAMLKEKVGCPTVWRCHIGLDRRTPRTDAAWDFLQPHALTYDRTLFTAAEYVPSYLSGRASLILPSIDPLDHKNRDLPIPKLSGVLCNGGMAIPHQPVLTPSWPCQARRYQPGNGCVFGSAIHPEEVGLLYRPVITQVSRWDRLKGFPQLMEGFARLKRQRRNHAAVQCERDARKLEIVRLVLAGPDPAAVQDDPEARGLLDELCRLYSELEPEVRQDIAIILLPMDSRKSNALMVNALQRCSTLVVQNSLQEGFGLTVTEAMWKRVPVIGTHALGLRLQIRDGLDGRLIRNPEDAHEIGEVLIESLLDVEAQEGWRASAQHRVYQEVLVFRQVARWLEVLSSLVERPTALASGLQQTGGPSGRLDPARG